MVRLAGLTTIMAVLQLSLFGFSRDGVFVAALRHDGYQGKQTRKGKGKGKKQTDKKKKPKWVAVIVGQIQKAIADTSPNTMRQLLQNYKGDPCQVLSRDIIAVVFRKENEAVTNEMAAVYADFVSEVDDPCVDETFRAWSVVPDSGSESVKVQKFTDLVKFLDLVKERRARKVQVLNADANAVTTTDTRPGIEEDSGKMSALDAFEEAGWKLLQAEDARPDAETALANFQSLDFLEDKPPAAGSQLLSKPPPPGCWDAVTGFLKFCQFPRRPVTESPMSVETETAQERFEADGWELLDRSNPLGEGSFGTVYQCRKSDWEDGKIAVAKRIVKKPNNLNEENEKDQENMAGEATIVNQLAGLRKKDGAKYPNSLPQFFPSVASGKATYEDDKEVIIVSEFAEGGTLLDFGLDKSGVFHPLSSKEVQNVAYQLLEAVQYLHANKIAHRDLKLENIMLKKKQEKDQTQKEHHAEMDIMAIDFGFSTTFSRSKQLYDSVGTAVYAAPEVLSLNPDSQTGYNEKVDIWSIGVILYMLLVGELPFGADPRALDSEQVKDIREQHEEFLDGEDPNRVLEDITADDTTFWRGFIGSLLQKADRRPSAKAALDNLKWQIHGSLPRRCFNGLLKAVGSLCSAK